jgi:ABC-type nickel/cobalt efflux system permease component RcnA
VAQLGPLTSIVLVYHSDGLITIVADVTHTHVHTHTHTHSHSYTLAHIHTHTHSHTHTHTRVFSEPPDLEQGSALILRQGCTVEHVVSQTINSAIFLLSL